VTKPILPKHPRLRLQNEAYRELRQKVLQRDAWRCQACGVRSNLEVHHREFRSHAGDDSERNLITLCADCHAGLHQNACQFPINLDLTRANKRGPCIGEKDGKYMMDDG
jgi:predicted HNH restriction endonuclease